MNATQTKNLSILVQSIRRDHSHFAPRVDWTEETTSWRKAWAIVDSCFADRAKCTKTQLTDRTWVLTIPENA